MCLSDLEIKKVIVIYLYALLNKIMDLLWYCTVVGISVCLHVCISTISLNWLCQCEFKEQKAITTKQEIDNFH